MSHALNFVDAVKSDSVTLWYLTIELFYKLDEIGNNASIGICSFTMWKQ